MKKRYSCLILTGLVLVTCMVIFQYYLKGDLTMVFSDIGSDTREQYLSQMAGLSQKLFQGKLSFYDFTNGFGTPVLSYSLTDPFIFLTIILGGIFGTAQIPSLLVYVFILRILLAALAAYLFLSAYRFNEKAKILGAFLYAFNGYLLVWGQHYSFGTAVILLPLILWCIEKSFHNKKYYFLLTLLTALTFFYSYYFGYMCFFTAGIFALLRIIQRHTKEEKKEGGKELGLLLLAVLLGMAMAAITMLPSLMFVSQNSVRLSEETSLPVRLMEALKFYPVQYYQTLGNRLLSGNSNGIFIGYNGFNNYYETPNLGITALFVLLLPQFLWFQFKKGGKKRKDKRILAIALVLSAFTLFIQAGSMIFNGFQYPFSRHTFVLIPFMVMIIASTWTRIEEKEKINWFLFALSLLFAGFLFYSGYQNAPAGVFETNIIGLSLCSLFMAVIVGYYGYIKGKQLRNAAIVLLLCCTMAYVIKDAGVTFGDRWQLLKNDTNYTEELYGKDIISALEYLEKTDKGFYRIEKDYTAGSLCMDSMNQGYFGIGTYNSTYNKNIGEFADKLWGNLKIMDNNHLTFRNTVNDNFMGALCSVKYVLSHNPQFQAPGYVLQKQFGSVYIYRNINAASLGYFFNQTVTAEDFEQASLLNSWELLSKAVIVDEKRENTTPVSEIELKKEKVCELKQILNKRKTKKQAGVKFTKNYIKIEPYLQNKNKVHFYLKDEIVTTDEETVVLEFDLKAQGSDTIYVGDLTGTEQQFSQNVSGVTHIRVNLPKNLRSFYIRIEGQKNPVRLNHFKVYKVLIPTLSDNAQIHMELNERQNELTGTVTSKEKGTVLLSVPYDKGWNLTVDGQNADYYRGDYGFIAFDTNGGSSQIKLSYDPIGRSSGAAVSLAALGLYFCGLTGYGFRKKITAAFQKNRGLKND